MRVAIRTRTGFPAMPVSTRRASARCGRGSRRRSSTRKRRPRSRRRRMASNRPPSRAAVVSRQATVASGRSSDQVKAMLELNDPDSLDVRNPDFIAWVAGTLRRTVWPYHRVEVRGQHRLPTNKQVIYIANHNGYPYMTEMFIFTSLLFEKLG